MNQEFYKIFLIAGLYFCFISPQLVTAESLTIAVASNFADTAKHLVEKFEANSGHDVQLITGSSGRFFAQISNGAPFDIFLSADREKPIALVEAGFARSESRFTYAIGRLALWSRDEMLVSGDASVLQTDKFKRIAIANPRLAPYGIAASEVLNKYGLYDEIRARLVQGENIAQAYQFVFTGNAELGFVALSQVMEGRTLISGSAWIIPEELHRPIRQDAVILAHGMGGSAAEAFMNFMKTPESRAVIASYGYGVEGL
ncbi:MAG: molybdate ABC transporter substrate-binding protein [Gammaproteobacteria bacterium]|nr:molybdate ABC transporter substrate-binding protein [Gammaproteobacteria bacterium]